MPGVKKFEVNYSTGYVKIKTNENTGTITGNPEVKGKYIIHYDYPLTNQVSFEHEFDGSLSDVISKICEDYKEIYERESETTTIPVVPIEQRVGLINRNTTNGEYGIWGHDIDDLYLHSIYITDNNIRLGIDS